MRRKIRRSPRTSSPVPRRNFRPVLTSLEPRTLLSTITWASDVSGDWDDPAMWSGGNVPGPNDDAVVPFSDITVTHDTSAADTVDSVNCAAALDITSGALTIDTTSSSQPTSIVSGPFNQSGGSLQLLSGNLSLAGGGTVDGTMTGDAGTNLEFEGSSFSFAATSAITSAGEVTFAYCPAVTVGGTYDVTGGTFAAGGTLSFTAPITSVGTDLFLEQGAVVNLPGQSLVLSTLEDYGSTLNGGSGGGASLTVTGSMTWINGMVTGFGSLDISNGATLDLGNGNNSIETVSGVELDNAGTAVLASVYNSAGIALDNGAGIDNQGTGSFSFASNATIYSDGSATYFTNEGNLTQPAGATNTSFIQAAFTQTGTGSTLVQGGGLQFSGGGTVDGTMTGDAGTNLEFEGSSFSFAATSAITSAGEVTFAYCPAVTVGGTYDVTGGTFAAGGTLSFTAPITSVGTDLFLEQGAVVNLPGQSLVLSTLEDYGSTLNGGSAGGASLTVTGTMTLVGGAVSGFGSLDIPSGLSGTGTINANVTSAGQVIPGGTGTAGTLTINGNYTQTATGNLDINIGGTTAGSQYGQLAVSGTATLGGTINVGLINGFQPAFGTSFQPLIFGASNGNFGFYNGLVLGSQLALNPTLNPGNLTLAAQPASTTATLTGPPSAASGESVTLTATVGPDLPPTSVDPLPTGTVTFYFNGNSIGTGTLSVTDWQDQATFSTTALPLGADLLAAQ